MYKAYLKQNIKKTKCNVFEVVKCICIQGNKYYCHGTVCEAVANISLKRNNLKA